MRRTSSRSNGFASSNGNSPRTSTGHPRKSRTEGQPINDAGEEQGDGPQNVLMYDLKEDIDIVDDRGDSLRTFHPQLESNIPEANNNKHEDLRTSLSNARVKATEGHFIPWPVLERLFTEESVRNELGQSLPELTSQELDELVQKICRRPGSDGANVENNDGASRSPSFLRVFATLVLIGHSADIHEFIRSGISDKDLPLSKRQLRQTHDGATPAEKAPFILSDWTPEFKEKFEAQQWELLAPFFSQSNTACKVRFYQLDSKDILPFTTDESHDSTNEMAGGFSKVSKITIHPDHHSFTNELVRSRLSCL